MFGTGNDPFGGQQDQGGQFDYGDRLVGRVLTQEYNLAQQRGDQWSAGQALGRLVGVFLGRVFSR